jgi:hypothetical protein
MNALVSRGNDKIGAIPNTSLPPRITCAPGVPCAKLCYAFRHAYNRFPHVKEGWDANLRKLRSKPDRYFEEISEYLDEHGPERFRIHVGGDFISQDHLDRWIDVARRYPKTRFLAFTKRYLFDFSDRLGNLSILLSRWPTLAVPDTVDLSKFAQVMYYDRNYQYDMWASYSPEDLRIPEGAHTCPGSCVGCSWCWDAKPGEMLLLPKH